MPTLNLSSSMELLRNRIYLIDSFRHRTLNSFSFLATVITKSVRAVVIRNKKIFLKSTKVKKKLQHPKNQHSSILNSTSLTFVLNDV